MSKVVCFFLLLLSSFFFWSGNVIASHTIDDNDISIELSPSIVQQDSKNITVTIRSKSGILNKNQIYTFRAWHVSAGENSCWDQAAKKPEDENTFIATWAIVGCKALPGEVKFQLWIGGGTQDRTDQSLIVKDFRFTIEQAGGKLPSLTPLQSPIQLGNNPVVILSNARKGNTYTFWWNGSPRELAVDPFTPSDDGNFNIQLNLSGISFQAGKSETICMEIGRYNIPAGLTCRFSTSFQFIATPPSIDNPRCNIIPANYSAGDSISLRAINLPKNQSFRADIVSAGQTTNLPTTSNSGDNGAVVLPLLSNASEGDYAAYLYDSNNEQKCGIVFTIGARGTGAGPAVPAQDICKQDPSKCSSAGGEACSEGGAVSGIKTAIGCVPTEPKALVEGILKVVSAGAGAVALLLMILGALQMITAEGNPENINNAREKFYSAIVGLLFIIFAVLLLEVIGYDILGLPGFNR